VTGRISGLPERSPGKSSYTRAFRTTTGTEGAGCILHWQRCVTTSSGGLSATPRSSARGVVRGGGIPRGDGPLPGEAWCRDRDAGLGCGGESLQERSSNSKPQFSVAAAYFPLTSAIALLIGDVSTVRGEAQRACIGHPGTLLRSRPSSSGTRSSTKLRSSSSSPTSYRIILTGAPRRRVSDSGSLARVGYLYHVPLAEPLN
jgi:hypothetical protein